MSRTEAQRIDVARLGGHALVAIYGTAHMRRIGLRGNAGKGRRRFPTAADRAQALEVEMKGGVTSASPALARVESHKSSTTEGRASDTSARARAGEMPALEEEESCRTF